MRLTTSVSRFERLTKRALQFAGRGKDVVEGYRLLHVEITGKGQLRISAQSAAAGAKVLDTLEPGSFEPGSFSVVCDHIDRCISLLPRDKPLKLTAGKGPKAKIEVGSVKLSIPTRPGEDFPPLPRPPSDGWFQVTDRQLSDVINHTLWAMCRDESRPALGGVHLTHELSETADGHMMARKSPGFMPKDRSVVVPGDAWEKLRAFVDGKDTPLRMAVEDERRVWLRGQNWAVFSTLIHQQFPNMGAFVFDVDGDGWHWFDNENKILVHWIHVNRSEALAAVRRIAGASVSTSEKKIGASVKFEVRDGNLHLISHYPLDDVSESIVVDEQIDWGEGSVTAADMSGFDALDGIGVYSDYMRRALDSLSSDLVRVMWAAPMPNIGYVPVQFHDEKIGMKAMVMPRRL